MPLRKNLQCGANGGNSDDKREPKYFESGYIPFGYTIRSNDRDIRMGFLLQVSIHKRMACFILWDKCRHTLGSLAAMFLLNSNKLKRRKIYDRPIVVYTNNFIQFSVSSHVAWIDLHHNCHFKRELFKSILWIPVLCSCPLSPDLLPTCHRQMADYRLICIHLKRFPIWRHFLHFHCFREFSFI
jgi:hypothetical protein